MAEYTPGPWKLSAGQTSALDANAVLVACAQYNPRNDPRGPRSRQEQAANARLIAAAPELRDALRLPLLFHAGGPWTERMADEWQRIVGPVPATSKTMCDHIRKVIAKATGESDAL